MCPDFKMYYSAAVIKTDGSDIKTDTRMNGLHQRARESARMYTVNALIAKEPGIHHREGWSLQ